MHREPSGLPSPTEPLKLRASAGYVSKFVDDQRRQRGGALRQLAPRPYISVDGVDYGLAGGGSVHWAFDPPHPAGLPSNAAPIFQDHWSQDLANPRLATKTRTLQWIGHALCPEDEEGVRTDIDLGVVASITVEPVDESRCLVRFGVSEPFDQSELLIDTFSALRRDLIERHEQWGPRVGGAPTTGAVRAVLASVRQFVLPNTAADQFVRWLASKVKDGPPDPARLLQVGGRYYRLMLESTSGDGQTAVTLWRVAETEDALRMGAIDLPHFNVEFRLSDLGGTRTEVTASMLLPEQPEVSQERASITQRFLDNGGGDEDGLERLRELESQPPLVPDHDDLEKLHDLIDYIAAQFGASESIRQATSSMTDRPAKDGNERRRSGLTAAKKRLLTECYRLKSKGSVVSVPQWLAANAERTLGYLPHKRTLRRWANEQFTYEDWRREQGLT